MEEEKPIKMYFKGGQGISNPVDVNKGIIKEGDVLTNDSFEPNRIEFYNRYFPEWSLKEIDEHCNKPLYLVKWNPKGFFYGEGLEELGIMKSKLYLHDFRFKYTKICK